MLVLTRSIDQKIILRDANDNQIAEILIVNVKSKQVRIGINASQDVKILREEVLNKINDNNSNTIM